MRRLKASVVTFKKKDGKKLSGMLISILWPTYLVENVVDIGCSFCRGFHEEKAILLSICLSFLQITGSRMSNTEMNLDLNT